jgi:putative protease
MPSALELLAPAGDEACARAAIANGADAVYFGLDVGFNARARAANISLDQLPRLVNLLHRHGVRAYATLNTLVFNDELPNFAHAGQACMNAGVDAVLVQDVGAARVLRTHCPSLPLHASTQMTLTSAECIALAEELGMERVVLARELSIAEITAIHDRTSMPLEVFVHGALCVAYSGQCLTSESFGGRSANRGQCAQACRLPYDLVCDGRDVDLGDRKYLLSPLDLAAYDLTPALVNAGVTSFKIEGRLKTPEYVANVTQHYRKALDAVVAGQPVAFTPREVEAMELSFSRGFSPGWLQGCDHKMLVPARSSAKRGVRLGTVAAVRHDRVAVDLAPGLAGGVKRGDGVAFDCGATSDEARGGRVYEVFQHGQSHTEPVTTGRVELTFGRNAIELAVVQVGQAVWKTEDPHLTARLRKTFTGSGPLRRQPVELHVTVAVGEPLRVQARTRLGGACEVVSAEPAQEARKHPLDIATLRTQLGRLGGTPFELHGLTATITGRPMLPLSVLGRVRHDLVAALEMVVGSDFERPERTARPGHVGPTGTAPDRCDVEGPPRERPGGLSVLHVLVRSLATLQTVLDVGERDIYADFADIRQYHEAVNRCRAARAKIHLATPRIHKPDEVGIFRLLARQAPDGVLARNYAGLKFFRGQGLPIVGDFSLNVTNQHSAEFFSAAGCGRTTASYDLNREQLIGLVTALPACGDSLEVVVHQHMPMFHMEHCVFCAVLSPGTNKTNCGRPCDDHVVRLRDRVGAEHLLTADVGCRNTLFNAVPQSAAEVMPELVAAGVRHFRIELLDEPPSEIARVIRCYRDLLAGRVPAHQVWRMLQAVNRVGVTRGTLEARRNPLAIL